MQKCYACGREFSETLDHCPYCKFPVISTTGGSKDELEKIRQFAAEYRRTNPKYFPQERAKNKAAGQNVQASAGVSEDTKEYLTNGTTAVEAGNIAALGKKAKKQGLFWKLRGKKLNTIIWIAIAALLIIAEAFLAYGACKETMSLPWIPLWYVGSDLYEEFFDVIDNSWLLLRDCFYIARDLGDIMKGFLFVIVSVVLGLGSTLLLMISSKPQKKLWKYLCIGAFWIVFVFYLHLAIIVPIANYTYYYRIIEYIALVIAIVINTLIVIQNVYILSSHFKKSLFDKIFMSLVSILCIFWMAYITFDCADTFARIFRIIINGLFIILIVRIIFAQVFPGSGRNPVKYVINRIRMRRNEVVGSIANAVAEKNPERTMVYEDGIVMCGLRTLLKPDVQKRTEGQAGDQKRAAEKISMPVNAAGMSGVEKVIRYADFEYDRMDENAMRAFTDLLIVKTGNQYVKAEQEYKHKEKIRTRIDGYTFTLTRQDLVPPPEPKPKKEKKVKEETGNKLKKW